MSIRLVLTCTAYLYVWPGRSSCVVPKGEEPRLPLRGHFALAWLKARLPRQQSLSMPASGVINPQMQASNLHDCKSQLWSVLAGNLRNWGNGVLANGCFPSAPGSCQALAPAGRLQLCSHRQLWALTPWGSQTGCHFLPAANTGLLLILATELHPNSSVISGCGLKKEKRTH